MKRWLGHTLLAVAFVALASGAAIAQGDSKKSSECRDTWWDDDRSQSHCEIREQTVAAGGAIFADAGQNGGISVKGTDRNDILVRTRVQTVGRSQSEADELAKQ